MHSDKIQLSSIITVAVLFSQGGSYSSQNYGGSQVRIASHWGFMMVLISMMADQYLICNMVM